MSRYNYILFVAILLLSSSTYSQTGYYGSKHSLEFKLDVASSLKRRAKIVETPLGGGYNLRRPLRLVHTNYGLNYNFVPSRRLELSLGVEYTTIRGATDNWSYRDGFAQRDLITAPKAQIINGKFEFKFYRKGSISPLGKYLGFSLQFGSAFVPSGQDFTYGNLGTESGNFFVREQSIFSIDTATTDLSTRRVFNLTLQGKVGRVWPLTQNISLVTGMSFPIGSAFIAPSSSFPILTPFLILDNGLFGTSNSLSEDGGWDDYLIQSVRRINSLALEVSLRFHL